MKHSRVFSRNFARFRTPKSRNTDKKNAALTRPRAKVTPWVLRNARGARRPSFAWAVRRNETKFAMRSSVFSRNLARFRMPKSRDLDAKCSADSAASFADVVRVAKRTQCTPAEFYTGGAPKSTKISTLSRVFFTIFYALSNAEAAQSRCQMQR